MAVDNINKRASLSGRRRSRLRPQADGSLNSADRRQLDGIYRDGEGAVIILAIIPIIPGVDERVVLVSGTDGSERGTAGNPLVTSAVAGGGTVSTANSTTTPLAAGPGGRFTGTAEDVSGVAAIVVEVFSDQISGSNQFAFEFSPDGVNWDVFEAYDYPAGLVNTGTAVISAPKAKFFRVDYINGATPQGVFRLQTVYHAGNVAQPQYIYNSPSGNYPAVRSAASLVNGFGGGTQPAYVIANRNQAGTFDFQHNHRDVVVQASTATGTGTINTDFVNYNATYLVAHANVSNYGAAGSFLMKFQMEDANNLFVDIPGATTGTLLTGADVLLVLGAHPWPPDTATAFYANFPAPRRIRLVEVVGVNSVTFSSALLAGGL